jgi:hypothetical protein
MDAIIIIFAVGFLLLLVLLVFAGLLLLKTMGEPKKPDLPYEGRGHLLSPAERSFLGVLERAAEGESRVLAKVRLADVIKTKPGIGPGERQKAFHRIQSKHLDFVLCAPEDYSIQAVIELDESPHNKTSRRKRDEFVDRALESAGIPITRIPARRGYAVEDIRTILRSLIRLAGSHPWNSPTNITHKRKLRRPGMVRTI